MIFFLFQSKVILVFFMFDFNFLVQFSPKLLSFELFRLSIRYEMLNSHSMYRSFLKSGHFLVLNYLRKAGYFQNEIEFPKNSKIQIVTSE